MNQQQQVLRTEEIQMLPAEGDWIRLPGLFRRLEVGPVQDWIYLQEAGRDEHGRDLCVVYVSVD